MTKNELVENLCIVYSKEQLALALISAVKSELQLLDNGCGNDLDFGRTLLSHLPKEESHENPDS